MQKVMIVEDDPKIADLLKSHIVKYGYNVHVVKDFDRVMDEFRSTAPDLVLLDINLPSFDGYYWCRQIRQESICPVLFISARTGEMDQVMALENGGDDFITKPFHAEIVMAKIRSQLRRAYGEYAAKAEERLLEKEGLRLYPERLELTFAGQTAALTKKEADIIESLMERHPRISAAKICWPSCGMIRHMWMKTRLMSTLRASEKSFRSSVLKMQWKQCGARAIA
ncbi:Response regulator protein GraR [Bacillus licheniformis]|nr:Response regulator protein GraR [Bacillus licheniformis]